MKKGVLFLMFLFVLFNVNALMFYSGECSNEGVARVTVNAGDNDSKIYSSQMKIFIDGVELEKEWSGEYFRNSNDGSKKYGVIESDEGMFNEMRTYDIEISYYYENDPQKRTITGEMECPGLRFSCALLNLSIDDCYTENGKFVVDMTILGIEQSPGVEREPDVAVGYNMAAEKRYLDVYGNNKEEGLLPAGYMITKLAKGKYRIEAPFVDNTVKVFYARFDLNEFIRYCDSSDYPGALFWDKQECRSDSVQEPVVEEVEEEEVEAVEEIEEPEDVVEEEPAEVEEVQIQTGNVKVLIIITVVVILLVIFGLIYIKKKGQM